MSVTSIYSSLRLACPLCTVALALGFRFKEQPALHSVSALRSLVIGRRALHSALTFVYALGKPLPIPAESFRPAR